MNAPACIRCRNYFAVATDEQGAPLIGECRAKPPQPFMLAMPQPRLDGKQGVQVNFPAAWPQVQPAAWCAEFTERMERAANG